MEPIALSFSPTPQLYVVAAPGHLADQAMRALITRLALSGPLTVVDGGNHFDAYGIARQARQHQVDVRSVLRQIQVARAFTCQQVLALLEAIPNTPQPKLVLNLLETFRGEDLFAAERMQIFNLCLAQLRRLSHTAPTVVSARLSAADRPEDTRRLAALLGLADHAIEAGAPPSDLPARLF